MIPENIEQLLMDPERIRSMVESLNEMYKSGYAAGRSCRSLTQREHELTDALANVAAELQPMIAGPVSIPTMLACAERALARIDRVLPRGTEVSNAAAS